MSPNRLQAPTGLLIDRNKPIAFSFEGETYSGYAGDTIASALAANNVWLLSRSFKYHRPRGVMSMAGLEANTLVQLEHEPNVEADRFRISAGLKVTGQNYTGSLKKDKEARISLVSHFLPVGFYYKAFFRPKGIWQRFWEPIVRRHAGLGKVWLDTPYGYYDKSYKFYDIAIIGSGPAGLSAALSAANAGAAVLLIEQEPELGGSLNYARFAVDNAIAQTKRDQLIDAIEAHANIEIMTDAICNAWFADNWLPIIQGNRLHKLRAKEVILACGKMEQPAIFHNNDLPGVLLGSAVQRLMQLYGIRPGKRAVVLTANDDGYGAALDLLEHGVEVAVMVDLRNAAPTSSLVEEVKTKGIQILSGHTVYAGAYDANLQHIKGVEVAKLVVDGQCATEKQYYDCDLLSVSVGYTPSYQLALQAGGKISYDDETAMFSITQLPKCLHLAGGVQGIHGLHAILEAGQQVGQSTAKTLGLEVQELAHSSAHVSTPGTYTNHPWPIIAHPQGKEFVDLDEDLQFSDIVNACKDGYCEIELIKRYSTVGMGPSQGRHSALATARIVAQQTNRNIAQVGVTTARPPYRAEKLGVIAGRSFEPERFTPMHYRHVEAGAQLLTAGIWWRPAFYGKPQDRDQCIREENLAIRNNVGLIDASTLGGLEIRGPDAAEFLNRMYTFTYAKQKTGTSRYLLMTNPAGTIIDDGVACRLDEEHFYITATTGGADNVYRTLLWWNAQWRLEVDITDVTTAYAGINIAGPNSRKVLQKVCSDIDLSPVGFPYLGVRTGTVATVPARLLRVGFVGELGYEIHVPASQGEALWDALMDAGKKQLIQAVGIEAQRLLRLEKGHIIVGQDTDAMTTPQEANMAWAIAKKKPFFVGGRSLQVRQNSSATRKLIGFETTNLQNQPVRESNLILEGDTIVGHVTSVADSPVLHKIIGMGFSSINSNPGTKISIKLTSGKIISAQVVTMPFFDPGNTRQEM